MIRGHSGYLLEYFYEGGHRIKKFSQSIDVRLYTQALKQDKFNKSPLYQVPKIHQIKHDLGGTYFVMDYIHGQSFIDYSNKLDLTTLDELIKRIIEIIEQFLLGSTITDIPKNTICEKYNLTKINIQKKGIILDFISYDNHFNNLQDIKLPVGICHGDLTLSNILFEKKEIYLIDFLDSFIESPFLDIVKIRQDTKFHWISSMYHGKFDNTKIKIILDYMDKKIDDYFQNYDFYINHYNTFELLNLLRVIQYANEEEIIEKIKKDLTKCKV